MREMFVGGLQALEACNTSHHTNLSCRCHGCCALLPHMDIAVPEVFVGGLLGAMLVFLFSAWACVAVGRTAQVGRGTWTCPNRG